jgi:serine/threonine-protein kinase
MVHRDLKPENIFLTTQGGIADYPKVLDFGLAKVTQREMRPGSLILTQEGMVFGTPEFMSPEQARGQQLDARSDIYSLGCILYEMLTGKLPFDASQPMDYLALQIRGTPIPLGKRIPGLTFPSGLEEVVMKTIAKEPDDRHASAADFAIALRTCMPGAVRDDAIRSVPPSDDSQRFAVEGRSPGKEPSARPQASPAGGTAKPVRTDEAARTSVSQSPVLWAALGAGAMLLIGAAIAAVVLLLR